MVVENDCRGLLVGKRCSIRLVRICIVSASFCCIRSRIARRFGSAMMLVKGGNSVMFC